MRTQSGFGQLAGVLLVAAMVVFPGCRRYEQDTPDSVLASARKMIAEQRADRLPDLVYAESKDMRKLLNQLGQTMGALQDLALSVQKAYPKEIAKLTEDAEAAAKNGEASSYIQKIMSQASTGMQGGRRRRGDSPQIPGGDPDEMRKTFDNALKEVFADPYGWLAKSEGRITTQSLGDEAAAIMWDGKPVFGVGLMMRKEAGKWYVVLPTTFPGVGSIMPKNADQWEVLGGLFQVFDNAFTDLATDVKKGKCKRLDELAAKAGEKMFIPAAMVVFAYSQMKDLDRKAQKAAAGDKPGPTMNVQIGGGKASRKGSGITVELGNKPEPKKEEPAAPK